MQRSDANEDGASRRSTTLSPNYVLDVPGKNPMSDSGQAGVSFADGVEAILRQWLELAKPDDLAFLESQAPTIAAEIAALLRPADPPTPHNPKPSAEPKKPKPSK